MSTTQFEPHNFTMGISPDFFASFLKKEFSIDFATIKDEKGEQMAERFLTLIKDHSSKDKIFVVLEDINDMSSPRHIDALLTRATLERKTIDEQEYKKCKKDDERAMWWYMYHRDIFEKYFEFNDLEDLSGAKEIIIPQKYTKTIDAVVALDFIELQKRIASIYDKSLRGDKCKVKHWIVEGTGEKGVRYLSLVALFLFL